MTCVTAGAGEHRRLVVGPGAFDVRRRVGPLAWCALETLAATATASGVGTGEFVEASVRSVAAELGLAPNSVHRALAVLRDAGFVSPSQGRGDAGRFAAGVYVLCVPPEVLSWSRSVARSSSRLPQLSSSPRVPQRPPDSVPVQEQLELLLSG